MKPAEPVFIVCNARSGSTLLRYLLDAHPEIASPAETPELAQAGLLLLSLHSHLAGDTGTAKAAKAAAGPGEARQSAAAAAAEVIAEVMSKYLNRRGKNVWCDKSLSTVPYLSHITRIFPNARYVCLHRHAMDVIASALEACRWGYDRYGFQPYIARHNDNFVYALAEYWTDRTRKIIALQDSAARTHSVHYEHLVRDPRGTLAGILEFLGLQRDDKLVQKMIEDAFEIDHDPGSADRKIPYTWAIGQRSVERGRSVPASLIESAQRAEMNALLSTLRYPVVTDDWNLSSDVGPDIDRALLTAADVGAHMGQLVDDVLASRLAAYDGPMVRCAELAVTYGDSKRLRWIIDSYGRTIRCDKSRVRSPALTVTMRAEVLSDLLVRGLPLEAAVRLHMVSVEGIQGSSEERAASRLVAALFNG